jgi:hypothetical protein
MNIAEAVADPNLLGSYPPFRDLGSWEAWLVFLRALEGLPLSEKEEQLFARHTGRKYMAPEGGWREAALICGRQSGKTSVAAAIVAHAAMLHETPRDGTRFALLLAQDARAALRTAFSYIKSIFESSAILRPLVESQTSDTLRLTNNVHVSAYPCRPAAIRGLRAIVACCDELSFFRSTENIAVDREMLTSLRPTLASTGGRLVILSSPYAQTGELYRLYRQHSGREESHTLVWKASAPEMNPTLSADYLERMRESDPEAYASEVEGEFRAGLSTLLDPETLESCVASDRLELPPVPGVEYRCFVDPSGGRKDAFTAAIGHRDSDRCVIDVLRAWRPPFSPAGVVEEIAELLRQYQVYRCTGDRYAGEWPREAFRTHGVLYQTAEAVKSDLYLAFLSYVNSSRVELPDDRELLRELRGLERRRGTGGKDRVDHTPGAHDDRANAVAGAAWLCLRKPLFRVEGAKF